MVQAKVENLGLEPNSGSVIVLLKAENGPILPIVIGHLEAQHILAAFSEEKPPRPLLPDLFVSVLDLLSVKLHRVEIIELKEGTFYARLILEQRGVEYDVDARPSDSLALALRTGAEILIAEEVLKQAGVDEFKMPGGSTAQA